MAETDTLLVKRALAGDREACDTLVRRYIRAAYAVALGLLGNPADAEDVCQDAFARCFSRLAECRDPDRFAGWLFSIVRSQALNFREYRARRATASLEDASAVASGESTEKGAECAELRDRLLDALAEIPDIQRQVVLFYDLEGWSHREIAQALSLSEGMSRQHLFHARRALRERLGQAFYQEYTNE